MTFLVPPSVGPLRFFLLINKQGQTRFSRFFDENVSTDRRTHLEGSLVRRCTVGEDGVGVFDIENGTRVVYRRYASLFFIAGVATHPRTNEILLSEWVHSFVERMDVMFNSVCELDIMFNIERVHFLLEETVTPTGDILDCCEALTYLREMDVLDAQQSDVRQVTPDQVVSGVVSRVGDIIDGGGGALAAISKALWR